MVKKLENTNATLKQQIVETLNLERKLEKKLEDANSTLERQIDETMNLERKLEKKLLDTNTTLERLIEESLNFESKLEKKLLETNLTTEMRIKETSKWLKTKIEETSSTLKAQITEAINLENQRWLKQYQKSDSTVQFLEKCNIALDSQAAALNQSMTNVTRQIASLQAQINKKTTVALSRDFEQQTEKTSNVGGDGEEGDYAYYNDAYDYDGNAVDGEDYYGENDDPYNFDTYDVLPSNRNQRKI